MRIRHTLHALVGVLLAAWLVLAAADGGGGGGGGGAGGGGGPLMAKVNLDPDYNAGVQAVRAEEYAKAVALLQSYVGRSGADADAQNFLGFSYRKLGQLDAAFLHYDKALAIDPRHLGAHEYLGEAYLMAGNMAKAEEHLKILDRLCFLPCDEYTKLKKAVAERKAAPRAAGGASAP